MLDLIPDKVRNGIYSLIPTLTLIFAVPQLILFVPVLILYGPVVVLCGLGVISLIGVIITALGLKEAKVTPQALDKEIGIIEEPTSVPISAEVP